MPRCYSVPIYLKGHGLFGAGEAIPDNVSVPEIAERFRIRDEQQLDESATSKAKEREEVSRASDT